MIIGDHDVVIVACRVVGGVLLGDAGKARGPTGTVRMTTAPTCRGFVLTAIDASIWRWFIYDHGDHPALIQGDLFAAPTLADAMEKCRVAPPRKSKPALTDEIEIEMRLAAE